MKKSFTNEIGAQPELNSSFTNEIRAEYEVISHKKAPPIEVNNTHVEYDWNPRPRPEKYSKKHYSYSVPTSPRHSYKHRQEKLENEKKNNKLDLPTIDPESKMTFVSELEFKINHYAQQKNAKKDLKEKDDIVSSFDTEIHNYNSSEDVTQMLIGDYMKTYT